MATPSDVLRSTLASSKRGPEGGLEPRSLASRGVVARLLSYTRRRHLSYLDSRQLRSSHQSWPAAPLDTCLKGHLKTMDLEG